MAEKIHIRNAAGDFEPLTEEPFETEDLLQELIGQHPELLAGEQMDPGDPLRWILIRREMPIEGWALDHLLIDQHARPTLVEVKRGSNREIRREVVGQMLDYAANAANVWSERDMRRIFEENSDDPDGEIGSLLQEDEDPDIDGFWEQVATNLAANRLRLLFVADQIPNELERVVKFLNEYTRDNLEVLAVEVKQYPGRFGDALVSRVIGQVGALHKDSPGGNSSRNQAHMEFFRALIGSLPGKHGFNHPEPNGRSYQIFRSDFTRITFGLAFGAGRKARVEIYFDRDPEVNKQLFDKLEQRKESIESEIKEELLWERLSSRRACRISVVRDGYIFDDEQTLGEIREWMVSHLLAFRRVFTKHLQEVGTS